MPGLYIHIPFCKRKCSYCDFYSVENIQKEKDFLKALKKEFSFYKNFIENCDTIYVGGGTPSVLTEKGLSRLCKFINKYTHGLKKVKEYTFEMNPESVTKEKALLIKNYRVNRISLGAQSFCDNNLAFLSRLADKKTFLNSFKILRKTGFKNISVDLIYGLPGQSLKSWKADLKAATNLNCEHISCYCLEIHKNTPLGKQKTKTDDSISSKLYNYAARFLPEKGYAQYEISNFAKPKKESLHNIGYWKHNEYLGLGPSACSYIENKRFADISDIKSYIETLNKGKKPLAYKETLSKEQKLMEKLMLGLRMTEGIEQKGDIFIKFKNGIAAGLKAGYLKKRNNRLIIKKKFVFLSDKIILDIVSA